MTKLKGVLVGAGYFSQFHFDAWQRIPEVTLTAVCDTEVAKAEALIGGNKKLRAYADVEEMLRQETPDFVDIATPPASHAALCRLAANHGAAILCQKPLAPTLAEAQALVEEVRGSGVPFMVHENYRFQPWHRQIKQLLQEEAIGKELFSLAFRMRMGDGWQEDAYLARQPYFRTMPRLLMHETGIHLIDTFRYLAGDMGSVYARLRRLNPALAGEDCGQVLFNFTGGPVGLFDGNRYNESNFENPRLTFGEMLVEGSGGSLRLYGDGRLTIQPLGKPEQPHFYEFEDRGFSGDCVKATLSHFTHALLHSQPFETDGPDYLQNLRVLEAVYASAASGQVEQVNSMSE